MHETKFFSSFKGGGIFDLQNEHEQLKPDAQNQEHYIRRNFLLVHGIPKEQGKISNGIALK